MAAVVNHHHVLFPNLTRFNSTRTRTTTRTAARGLGVSSVRCSYGVVSENRQVTLSNKNDSLDICRVLNGMWQTSGGWGRIDRDAAVEAMLLYADAGLSTFDMADHCTYSQIIQDTFPVSCHRFVPLCWCRVLSSLLSSVSENFFV